MADIRNLTAKAVRLCIKRGMTPEDIERKYACSEEELRDRLAQLYHKGSGSEAQSIFRDLESNRKKHRGSAEPETISETMPPDSVDLQTEEIAPESEPPVMSLEELTVFEQTLSSEVMELKTEREGLLSEYRVLRKSLRQCDRELEDYAAKIKECRDRADDLIKEANKLADEINNLTGRRRQKVDELDDIRSKIEDRQTVSIYIYSDGRIEVSENPEFVVDDTGYLDLKVELLDKEECYDLRLRDINTLARLKKIVESASRVLLIFDDRKLEEVYYALFPI